MDRKSLYGRFHLLKITITLLLIFCFSAALTPSLHAQQNGTGTEEYDSWPMFQHDVRHTGRSPYGVDGIPGVEKWKFWVDAFVHSSPAIDNNGIIYIGTYDFYALYPNGTLKWKFSFKGGVESSPAIDENGTIYFGSEGADDNYLYALYPDGTVKWKYRLGNHIKSSPTIGTDGTIYFGRLYSNYG